MPSPHQLSYVGSYAKLMKFGEEFASIYGIESAIDVQKDLQSPTNHVSGFQCGSGMWGGALGNAQLLNQSTMCGNFVQ